MTTNDAARASDEVVPAETRNVLDALNLLSRVKSLNETLFMAGESLSDRRKKNAITTQCDVINDLLEEVDLILEASVKKGGAA